MESVATGESKLSPSAAGRKMKQTRLPFQVLSGSPTPATIAASPTRTASPTAQRIPESRKRKPSLESVVAVEALRAAKVNRTSEAKENVNKDHDGVDPADVVIMLDDNSVDVDEGSNSRDLVDVRKDGKLVKVSTPRTPKSGGGTGDESGEGSSDRKIRIKLPMASSKKRKSAGGKEGSEKKKKAGKEKKKGKKGGKEVKGKVEVVGEPIAIDDSDLSEDEKVEDEKEQPTEDKKEEEVQETVKQDEAAKEDSKKTTEETQDKVEKASEATVKAAEVTPRRGRGRQSRVSKDDNEKKKSPKARRSSAKAAKTAKSETSEEVKEPEEDPKETKETVKEAATEDKSETKVVEESAEVTSEGAVTEKSKEVKKEPSKASSKTESSDKSEKVKEQPKEPSKTESSDKSEEVKEEQSEELTETSKEKSKEVKEEPRKEPSNTDSKDGSEEVKETDPKEVPKVDSSDKSEEQSKQPTKTSESSKKSKKTKEVKEDQPKKPTKTSESCDKTEEPKEEPPKASEDQPKEDKEAKTPVAAEGSSSTSKRTRYSRAASEKKPEKEEDTKKPSSAKGALDKFFAKVQEKEDAKPKIVVTTEAEPMEVEEDQQPAESSRNNTIASICLDDSDDGENTADAEENAYMLCTPNSKERTAAAVSGAVDNRKLTPKQMARKMEAEKRLALKQQELEDRKRKKLEEKEAKQKEKEEQERLRKKEKEEKEEQKRKEREEKEEAKRKEREEKEEQKKKEKEEKEEAKRKEREEKEKKRQAELDAKNEEKRKKDEQKEEERRKKEEEKEAEEKRKQKTAQAFQSFFVKKQNGSGGSKHSDDENSMDQQSSGEDPNPQQQQQQAFMPFCVKGDMRLAPTVRATLPKDRKQRLEELLRKSSDDQGKEAVVVEDPSELYLGQLKSAQYQAGTMDRTWIADEEDGAEDDVMIVDDDVCHQIEEDQTAQKVKGRRYRAKYFLFEENRRPPYRGTWRKKSENIRPRRPFAQDTKFFDYEVDSDDEWEEEEPGESLHGSDDEKDVDKEEEDYEVDNDFFVPHGHLSDEELQAEDDVADDNSPEAQKAKLKIMQQEFAAEMKKKTEKIKPRLIGCLWENGSGNERSECSAVIWEILKARAMLFDPEEPISFTTVRNEPDSNSSSPSKPGEEKGPATERVPKVKTIKLGDEGVRELIQMIHGCAQNRSFLVKEFLAYWGKRRDDGEKVPQYAPDSIRTKILEISSWRPCPEEGPMQNKMCWYVNKEALVRYELADLKVPTGWNYILKPIVKSKKERKDKEKNGEGGGGGGGEGEEGGEEKKTPPKKKSNKEVNGEEKEKKDRQSSTPSSSSKSKPAAGTAITKFTKKLSDEEKRKQFAKERKKSIPNGNHNPSESAEPDQSESKSKPKPSSSKKPAPTAASSTDSQQPKKRVQLLMSVPRGQSIPQATKNNLISQFLAKKPAEPEQAGGSSGSGNGSNKDKEPERMDVDEVVVLDD